MARARKIDYERAAVFRAAGATYVEIARVYGVSASGVRLALDEEARLRARAWQDDWQASGTCPICGSPSTRTKAGSSICKACTNERLATSVRPDALRCGRCQEWKSDEAFPFNRSEKKARRGRHSSCRACQTVIKRAYRERYRAPCSHGCGRLVDTKNRKDPTKPLECPQCALRRIHLEQAVLRRIRANREQRSLHFGAQARGEG